LDQLVDRTPQDFAMTGVPEPAEEQRLTEVRKLLGGIGADMVAAGAAVDGVRDRLQRVALAYRVAKSQIVVLPTVILIELGAGERTQIQVNSPETGSLRFDQIDALYRLETACEGGQVEPVAALGQLTQIRTMAPPYPAAVRVLGHGLLTAGLSLLLQPSLLQAGVCFALGIFIGLLKLPRLPTLELLFPILATFVVSLTVFWLSVHVDDLANPLRILIPPLVTFLPAGAMTTATVELAAGEMIAGSSRLVWGLVRLMMLAFAILAAATLVNLPLTYLIDAPIDQLGAWAPWLGVILMAVGHLLLFSSRRSTLPWITLVLIVAYAGQTLGAHVFDPELSGFFGAFAMTPLVLWLEDRPYGPPAIITFLPGFWLLVPGATGLIGLTEIIGIDRQSGGHDFASALLAIMSIALGVLVATSVYRTADASYRAARHRLDTQ
jgi:uncharacterized membrane protein YjjP (DUF1212 family)/uncharacterized membrane protein YjjB (DUF3815 family)